VKKSGFFHIGVSYLILAFQKHLFWRIFMTTLTIEMPETAFSAIYADPKEFSRQMRIAAAIKWYELGRISQNKGAEIAGISRAEFIDALSNAKVSPLQITAEQLQEELADAD
jgi:predicted HTH domain antitoxin